MGYHYGTYGSVAYAPVYDGAAVRAPRQEEVSRRRQAALERQREKALTRAQVQVRQAGQVAAFAVVGFLAAALFAALLLLGQVRLTVANGEAASLRADLEALQAERATLTAEYERVFDLATIEAAVGDTMVRPTGEQVVYIDLSAPDTVEVYGREPVYAGPLGAVRSLGEVVGGILEYFR